MRTITQRELRDESGAVMRQLVEGESFLVTSRGVPVGTLRPIDTMTDAARVRSGNQLMTFPPGLSAPMPAAEALRELRGDR